MKQIAVQVPILTFSDNEHSRSSPALDDNIDSRVLLMLLLMKEQNQKPTKSKIKTEVEENYLLTNC